MTYRDDQLGAALRELDVPQHGPGFERRLRRSLRPRRRRAPLLAAAAALLLAALAVALLRSEGAVEPASAAEVQARVRTALAALESLQGRIAYRFRDEPVLEWTFAATGAGDVRLARVGGPNVVVYDAARGVERSLNTSESAGGDTIFPVERRGLAPGPPDPAPSDWILGRELAAYVRALLAADDPRVEETVHEGREAWRLVVPVRPNEIFADVDRLEVVVDRATGIPVRVLSTLQGAFVSELRIDELVVDAPLPRETFALAFEPGAEVSRTDAGFRRVALAQVRGAVGYAPPVPAALPEGFGLAEVAVSGRVVSLGFRRGLELVVVTARPGGAAGDPFVEAPGLAPEPESVSLGGAEGHVVVGPRFVPHLWAERDGLLLTVAGDLGRDELVRAVRSIPALR